MRPLRTVLKWQAIVTVVFAAVAAIPWGGPGAVSALLGGAVNLVAGGAYGFVVSRSPKGSAGETLRTMFRAEAVKVLVIVVGLWLAFGKYGNIVHAAFLGTFVVTVAIFAAAIAVRDDGDNNGPRPTGGQ